LRREGNLAAAGIDDCECQLAAGVVEEKAAHARSRETELAAGGGLYKRERAPSEGEDHRAAVRFHGQARQRARVRCVCAAAGSSHLGGKLAHVEFQRVSTGADRIPRLESGGGRGDVGRGAVAIENAVELRTTCHISTVGG